MAEPSQPNSAPQRGRQGFASSIRGKLALLAGIPVFGACLLSFQVVRTAQDEARRAAALGSVESLADLSAQMSALVGALQHERDVLAGALAPNGKSELNAAAFAASDARWRALEAFLAQRDRARLPRKLAAALADAQRQLGDLNDLRAGVARHQQTLDGLLDFYAQIDGSLIRATAGLGELSADGEILSLVSSLSVLLELNERASQEHALLTYVLTSHAFPPGSYRRLVALSSEQDIYTRVFRAFANADADRLLLAALGSDGAKRALALRKLALETNEDELDLDPAEWTAAQQVHLDELTRVRSYLEQQTRRIALAKIQQTERATTIGTSLAGAVILFSLACTWLIARGLTRRVEQLRDASRRVASGDLSVRVNAEAHDELGQLGAAFNEMIRDLARAQRVYNERQRMSRELEIAATIQRSMLPAAPRHREFEFAGKLLPADEVGGDFYDVLLEPGGDAMWITIGDVSGHGIGAGLVMLMAQAAFASHFLDDVHADPEVVLRAVNRLLHENITERLRDNKYLTAQLLYYAGGGRFVGVGAHEWPLVFRAKTGRCEAVPLPGPWLGVVAELPAVPKSTIELEPDDVLCLYSDGLIEAMNDDGELFDMTRLTSTLERELGKRGELGAVPGKLFAEVEMFSGRHDDDWTVLLVRRRASDSSRE